jgi:DNA-directed RNA polymerase specialized sigma24 family protein
MDRFQEILIQDRSGYDDRMDYFEVNFDAAVASLKSTARRKAWKEENASRPLSLDEETNDLSPEIEAAAAAQNPLANTKIDDPDYRSRLDAAIDGLPPNQRRIIELLRQGIPIETKEPDVPSIVDLVGAVEKTVRNRRDRAFEAIRKALKEEEP